MSRLELKIDGMSCSHCIKAVQGALEGLPGVTVKDVEVGRAEVEVAEDGPVTDRILQAVADQGYLVRVAG